MLFGISSGKNTRATSQAKCLGSLLTPVAMNHKDGQPSSSSVHSVDFTSPVSMQNSFIGDLESMNAYHAKEETQTFEPQFGLGHISVITDCLSSLSEFSQVSIPDHVIKEVEGLTALLLSLKDCVNVTQFTSIVFLYVRSHCETSVSSKIISYLKDVFDDDEFVQQSDGQPAWLNMLQNVQQNWSLVKGNKAFRQLSKLLGVLVMLGLCDAADLTFDIAGFKLFDTRLLDTHMTAFDIVDALLGTVTFFAEGIYKCFKTGSIRPLLVNDQTALELDEEFALLVTWWDLVKCGNLERTFGVSDQEFGRRIRLLNSDLSNLVSTLKGLDRKLVNDKLMKIMTIRNELVTFKISSGIRKAPFAVELFGKSSQGKTTFGDQLVDALLTSSALPTGKEFRCVINASDKFISNWTSDKLVAIVDDMAQDKPNFVEKAPTRVIIDICNNQMHYAPKADLESKGKCFMEPEIFLVNTNVKSLEAYVYANCPFAIQRRLVLVFTVVCKDEFQLKDNQGRNRGVDSAKVREYYTVDGIYTPQPIEDIWNITVEQAVEPDNLTATASYEAITWRGRVMTDVSASVAIACACEYYGKHRINQEALMQSMQKRDQLLVKCPEPKCVFMQGHCPDHGCAPCKPLTQQFGLQTVIAAETFRRKITRRVTSEADSFLDRLDAIATDTLYKQTDTFLGKWDWLCILPESCIKHKYFHAFAMWNYSDEIKSNYNKHIWTMWIAGIIICCFMPLMTPLVFLFIIYQHTYAMTNIKKNFMDELKKRNDCLPLIVKKTRDTYAKQICYTVAGIGALYICARMYRSWKSLQPAQSSLEPTTVEDVKQRDAIPNVWAPVVKRDLPVSEKIKTTTWQQLETIVEKNLVYGSVQTKDNTLMCNMLFLKSNVVVLPNHYFANDDTLLITCSKKNADAIGGKFTARLCKTSSYHIPDTDLRLCYSSTGGSFKDITEYFPEQSPGNLPFHMVWRKKNGDILPAVGRTRECKTSNTISTFDGGEYDNLSMNTFGGLCGATLIAQINNPIILGFHVGGAADTPKGCYCQLTKQQIVNALPIIRNVDGVLFTGNIDKFKPNVLGVNILTDQTLHPKSPLNYLPNGSQFEYHGSCPGMVSSRSDVKPTPISDVVTDVTGIENVWGPPKMRPEWFGWQKCMANASIPGTPFPHDLLANSIADYKAPLIALIKTDMWCHAKPLTDNENLCGIPGVKFIDSINLQSSIGFPLTGPKTKFIVEMEATIDNPHTKDFTPEIKDEISRCEDLYRKGFRTMLAAKACKKDEVLPIAKDKCRIMYGNSVVTTFLIRKRFLPILRFLQMNPLLAECAVGINCHGPEWEEFYTHVTQHGLDTLFGGDYGKYDQKLSSQLIISSIRILIDLARECNYTEDDLNIMEAMAGDIAYALIAFNGDLVSITSGTHISGNSLTVVVNGISGSLNLRNFFYTVYPKDIKFRDATSMSTYGDDNIGTVSKEYPKFNIKDCAEFLDGYGQTYTMPDKESELKEYLDEGEFEFLKRTSVYHPKLGIHLGALDKKSIYKSLHCYMRPKGHVLTPEQACALNIDTGLREFFNHGESVYERERLLMKEIALKSDLTHICTMLDETYNDRVSNWKNSYVKIDSDS